jgi:DNA-binding FadR family transcriptional regulator
VIRAHRGVTDAVLRGQADAAKRRMERHLTAYAATVTESESADVHVA